jgi:hypothetical protein
MVARITPSGYGNGEMTVSMSGRSFAFPGEYVGELADCGADPHAAGSIPALRKAMRRDGYLLLRGFADRDAVLATRRVLLEQMAADDWLASGGEPDAGRSNPARRGAPTVDSEQPAIADFYHEQPFLPFFARYFGEPAMIYPKILTRVKNTGGRTGVHFDNVYIGRGSPRVLSCWMPWGDVSADQGSLAICSGSHNLASFARLRDTYGRHDPDRDFIKGADNAAGHFSFHLQEVTERFGGRWLTANFRAGDVLIFPPFTMHCALDNTTDRFRISSDTRFQPATDPTDARFMTNLEPRQALRHRYRVAGGEVTAITMDEARAKWGLEDPRPGTG